MERGDVSCFLLGLGVGIGIGLLFAPKSGEETRGMLKSKAGEGKDYLKQRSTDLRDSANDLLEKGKDAVSRQKDNLMEAMEAGKQAYRDTVGEPPPPPPAPGTQTS
jgi:gas vesicle protein